MKISIEADVQDWKAVMKRIDGLPGADVIYWEIERNLPTSRWIVVYDVQRYYGGPEEGGWWYNAGSVVRSVAVPLAPDDEYENPDNVAFSDEEYVGLALEATRIYYEGCNASSYPLSSVLSSGEYRVELSDEPPTNWPERTPHYE